MTAASRRLALTRSAVSHSLRALEASLGLPLFHRVGKRLIPTREGRVLRGFRALPRHANAHGIVHGGMLAAFIDSTMGVAVHRFTGRRSVTLRLVTDFLAPGRIGEWIEAEAELVGSDETVAHIRASLRGPRHLVMTGLGSFALLRSARPLRYPGRPAGAAGEPTEQG